MNIFLNTLNSQEKKLVTIKKYIKGTTLFHEGSICYNLCIILEGQVKISSFKYNGDEIIYAVINKDGIFGNNLIFSSNPIYKGEVIVEEDSKIAFINKDNLINILQNNKSALISYLNIQSDFGKDENSRIKLLSFYSAEERILYYLYINKNIIKIKSITNLSSYLSLTREATSRGISKLVKENKILFKNKTLSLIKNNLK